MIAVLAISWPNAAHAQPAKGGTLSLEWSHGQGADGCPSQQALVAAVAQRLPDVAMVPPELASKRLVGHVEPGPPPGGGWLVTFQARDKHGGDLGNRLLHADEKDCKDIEVAVALIATLLAEAPKPAPVVTPLPPPAAATAPTPPPPAPTAPEEPPIVWEIVGGAASASGLLPSFSVGPSLGASLRPDWPLALSMRVDFLPEQDLLGESQQARFTVGHARFGGCRGSSAAAIWSSRPARACSGASCKGGGSMWRRPRPTSRESWVAGPT